MKFSIIASLLIIAPILSAYASPTFTDPQLAFLNDGDEGDICPDLLVRCLKDGDVRKVVGDIGEKNYCRKGATCKQCHPKRLKTECDLKYPIDCATKCEAVGSPI